MVYYFSHQARPHMLKVFRFSRSPSGPLGMWGLCGRIQQCSIETPKLLHQVPSTPVVVFSHSKAVVPGNAVWTTSGIPHRTLHGSKSTWSLAESLEELIQAPVLQLVNLIHLHLDLCRKQVVYHLGGGGSNSQTMQVCR